MADGLTSSTVTGVPEADFWFVLPPGFLEIDLGKDAEERMLKMADTFDPLFPEATPEQKLSLILSCEYTLEALLNESAVHLSQCLYKRDDEGYTQGVLAVFMKELNDQKDLSVRRVAEQWAGDFTDSEVGIVEIRYGTAAICTQDREVLSPAAIYGAGDDSSGVVRQFELFAPLSSGSHAVTLTFTTEDIDLWEHYLQLIIQILGSFSDKEPPLTDLYTIDGGGVA